MFAISITADLKPLQRAFINLHARQVPFANSLALNNLAKGLAQVESELLDETFDKPTPFTERAFRITVATKSKPIAIVQAKDIQAAYLDPYVEGGLRYLGAKRAMLTPRDIALNKYGNLPRNKLASLKTKPGTFIGTITTKAGKTVSGVWQRGATPRGGQAKGAPRAPLKLLIQFEDTTPVRKRLRFYETGTAYLRRNAAPEYKRAMRRALATAR